MPWAGACSPAKPNEYRSRYVMQSLTYKGRRGMIRPYAVFIRIRYGLPFSAFEYGNSEKSPEGAKK